jgi:hypothetical protein
MEREARGVQAAGGHGEQNMKACAWRFICATAALGQVPHQHHPPSSEEYAKVLKDPSRDARQKPHAVVILELTVARPFLSFDSPTALQ